MPTRREQFDDAGLHEWLGISRTPIREAIIALQVEEVIEIVAQTHTRVVDPAPESVEEALQTAGVVFGGIIRTVVPKSTDARAPNWELLASGWSRMREALGMVRHPP